MRQKYYEHGFLITFAVGLLLSIAALIWSLNSADSTPLGNTGDFVGGVTGIFGILIGAFAILTYVKAEDSGTKVAARAWASKLRLEEALHMFTVLIRSDLLLLKDQADETESIHEKVVRTPVADLYFVGPGLVQLQRALDDALVSGLYRALANPSARIDKYDLSAELVLFAGHVRRHLQDKRVGLSANYFENLPRIYQGLLKIDESMIRAGLDSPLPESNLLGSAGQ